MSSETDQPSWAPTEQVDAARTEAADNGGAGPPSAPANGAHDGAVLEGQGAGAAGEEASGVAGAGEKAGDAGPCQSGVAPAPEADLAALLLEVERQRDEYLDTLRRVQADFDNYRKRVERQRHEAADNATASLVKALLVALDTADLALAHGGGEDIKQDASALSEALAKEGLERIDPEGQAFDPAHHDAIAHEPAEALAPDGDAEEAGYQQPFVSEVMRAGYRWRGRVLRPAMVKVKG